MKPIILVVEDNETEQYVLSQLLDKFDYNAQIVSSGEEAITAAGRARFAAVLMDITLPGMDGFECTRKIRLLESDSGHRTPVIALTARSQVSDREECFSAGMDDYISKPFDAEELRKVLLRYVYDPAQPNLKTLAPLRADELSEIGLHTPPSIDQLL